MTVIDVHTHMLSDSWVRMLNEHGGPTYTIRTLGERTILHKYDAPTMTLTPGMFDYEMRMKALDEAKIDLSIISLTSPSVFWGSPEVSAETARRVNDDMRQAQTAYPDRLRWIATLPWQYAGLAVAELKRACDNGAVGVMVLANIDGVNLTDPSLAPIWEEIDRRALPVLMHPTMPQGADAMDLEEFNLVATVGFMCDTTLSIARMIFDGFIDRYPNLKLIVTHAGGAIPYLAGRLDIFHELSAPCREKISDPPSSYLRRIYYDATVYQLDSLKQCINVGGADRVMYGTDYPHTTGDPKGCLARIDALPADQRKAVRGANARRIFDL